MNVKISNSNQPVWKVVNVKSHIPEALKKLDELAHNLWWSWNTEALDLFESLDKDLWRKVRRNPIDLLRSMDYDRLKVLSKDEALLARMNKVYGDFRKYMDVKPDPKRASVAYFCMEYGLSHVLKIYSGGLGILAGDYLKEASDSNVDMIAVGFLYRYGYFTQSLSMDGQQIANYEPQDFENLPIERVLDEHGNQLIVDVPYPNFMVHAALWVANVGRIKLYLLDTDNELNSEYDRRITHSLYGGDWENRIKQEYLLGIGGMLALKKMGITKEIYHCNEGHAALCNVQRLVDYVESGLNFNQALELVRASSLYTVHTPVPAGHDYFDEGLFNKYMNQFPARLGISWDDFMGLGRTNPEDKGEKFCMSTFLCKTCQEVNGVSWLHGRVSQQMFKGIWPGYMPAPERLDHAERTHDEWAEIYNPHPEESHVGYVTNGVHFPTWCAKEWQAVYAKYLGKDYIKDQSNEAVWENIYNVPDEVIWNTRVQLKNKLIDYIRARFREKLGFDIIYSCFTRRELLHYVDLSHHPNAILDVGCSCGGNLCQLHTDDPSAELYGIEFNKHAAAIAQHFASVDAIDVETLHRPEWHDKFQNIILADLLEHLHDPWQALRNMYRITCPGGRIIISIPNIMHISILRGLLNSDWNYADAGILDRTHLRFFTRKTATAMVTNAGYHILQYGSSLPSQSEEERTLKEKLLPLLGPDASADDLDAYQWHIVAEK